MELNCCVAETNTHRSISNFSDAINSYRDMILSHHNKEKQAPGTNKAMIAITKSLKLSMKCTPATHQNQMHNFGKGTTSGNRTKRGAVIKVNSPAMAFRKFKIPGGGILFFRSARTSSFVRPPVRAKNLNHL